MGFCYCLQLEGTITAGRIRLKVEQYLQPSSNLIDCELFRFIFIFFLIFLIFIFYS